MKTSVALILASLGIVLASTLSCQTLAPIKVHCCASESSEIIETVLPSNTVLFGCADDFGNGWFRNHAGHYARVAGHVGSCMLTETGTASNTASLPKCGVKARAATALMKNGTAFLAAACDAKCVTNGKGTKKRTIRTTLRNYGITYHNITGP